MDSRTRNAAIIAWALPLLALAQVQSQVQPATTNANFTVSSQLIVEEVSVKDKKGKTIEGLKKEDFVVTEDGKPQTIRFFDFEDIEKVAESAAAAAALPAPDVQFQLTQTGIAPERPG